MTILLKRAQRAGERGEVPVAAIILDSKGKCIGHGSNSRNEQRDPMGHSEISAIRQACLIKKDWRLNDCTLLVTLEPCPMCAAAIIQARIGQVIYGASDFKRGAFGGTIDLSIHPSSHHKMTIIKGILNEKISLQLENWFRARR